MQKAFSELQVGAPDQFWGLGSIFWILKLEEGGAGREKNKGMKEYMICLVFIKMQRTFTPIRIAVIKGKKKQKITNGEYEKKLEELSCIASENVWRFLKKKKKTMFKINV